MVGCIQICVNSSLTMNNILLIYKTLAQIIIIFILIRNTTVCGYNSLTDSQFFTGSQFWTENSQSVSQEKSLSSRTSLQSSQEVRFICFFLQVPLSILWYCGLSRRAKQKFAWVSKIQLCKQVVLLTGLP